MLHVGKNTRSRIVSKGISAGKSRNCYRGLVQVQPSATGARNHSQCDSMLIGDMASANTYPYITVRLQARWHHPVVHPNLCYCFPLTAVNDARELHYLTAALARAAS